jgi:hypothetical protein
VLKFVFGAINAITRRCGGRAGGFKVVLSLLPSNQLSADTPTQCQQCRPNFSPPIVHLLVGTRAIFPTLGYVTCIA